MRAPIVLAHGLFGFVRIGVGPLTFVRYFRGVPEFLRAAGNRVLMTRVHPTAGILRRGRKLGERIESAFGREPVHILGHSMGGFDGRALLADPAWSGRILSLTTIGTPHLGSSLADAAKLRMKGVFRALERIGLDHNGFHDLTRRSARALHRSLVPAADVPCFSVAGDPTPEEVARPLRGLQEALGRWEGPNDGLVSIASALAFGTPLDPWPADHFAQMGWLPAGSGQVIHPRLEALYAALLENLAAVERGDAVVGVGCPSAQLVATVPV